ncbi:hypothetical protein V1512DRAFT_261088 [Lipomyces arxii]|uniref:uncharacterized protein n=1 Tax=Lipomyces arxii TaxID=56418 RepID=UPI0034CD7B43
MVVVIQRYGLPSPNPSIDLEFSQDDEKVFDKAFQRVFDERARFDQVLNPLPTPASETCFSSDEADLTTDTVSDHEHHDHDEPDEYPFSTVELSLFYPDTAPRDSWRPQVETWVRRNYSYKLIDRVAVSRPYNLPKKSVQSKNVSENRAGSVTTPKAAAAPKQKVVDVESGLLSPSPSVSPSPANKTLALASVSGRRCISCGSDQSPCWRPSWSIEAGQLCNSCGLRYKKTGARCLSSSCGRIPAKGEWVTMRSTQSAGRYSCLYCGGGVAVGENSKR